MAADWMVKAYYRFRRYVPARLLYDPAYFEVLALSSACEADPQRLAAEVDARLRRILLEAVTHVPFYRDTVKISAKDLAGHAKATDLLQAFPYLEKATIMQQQDRFLNERYRNRRRHYATSAGSSGQGIGLWRTKRLADAEKAFFAAAWGKFGFSFERSRILRIGADARRAAHESPLREVGNRLMLSPYHVDSPWRDQILAGINRYAPEFIHTYPSSLFELCKLIEPRQITFRPKAILLASEPVLDYQLERMEATFGCPISFNYGLTERTNIAFGSYRNGARSPSVMTPLYGYPENRERDGRYEIVGTSLWNDVMPLIRYCTADFGRIGPDWTLNEIEGRSQEFLTTKQGTHFPGMSIVIDEPTWDFVKYYQIRQTVPGKVSLLLVSKTGPLSAQQKQYVLDQQLKNWGGFFDIELNEVDDIPLTTSGKRRLVVCELTT